MQPNLLFALCGPTSPAVWGPRGLFNTRRPSLAPALIPLLATAFALFLGAFGVSPARAQSNIVLITSDDQNWRDYAFTGDSSVRDVANQPVSPLTPTIDGFFTHGVTYAMGHVAHAVCRPSLVSLMTGLNPVQNGVYGNDPVVNGVAQGWSSPQNTQWNDILRRNVELNATLPRLLSERRYFTLQTGKWWEGAPARAGFSHAEPFYEMTDAARHLHNYQDGGANSIGRAAGSVTTRLGAFVDQALAAQRPFFISYAPFLPHGPFNAPAIYTQRYSALISQGRITAQQASYLACIDWFDATLAELRALLQSRGVEDNTLYVYVTDNGWLMPASGSVPSYGGNGGKMTPFEAGVRTPIIFWQNGRITDARPIADKLADARLAAATDIMPTLLRLVGVDAPETLQGVDLLAGVPLEHRRRMFGDTYLHDQDVLVSNAYRLGSPEATLTSRWMIEDRWKLILVTRNPVGQSLGAAVQLYDLATDPHERVNLAAGQPARVAAMTALLEQWWSRTRPVYLLGHEFNSTTADLNAMAPDVRDSSLAPVAWAGTTGLRRNGSIAGVATAQLPWSPPGAGAAGRRFELRASIEPTAATAEGVGFGFFDAGAPAGGPADDALAWVRVTRSSSGTLQVALLATADGRPAADPVFTLPDLTPAQLYALSLVLDTRDADPARSGDQWSLQLLSNGVPRYRHVFTAANPAIAHIGLGGLGPSVSAQVDYLTLVETPLFSDAAASVPAVSIDSLYAQHIATLDWNGDGAANPLDTRNLADYLRRREATDMANTTAP